MAGKSPGKDAKAVMNYQFVAVKNIVFDQSHKFVEIRKVCSGLRHNVFFNNLILKTLQEHKYY